MMGGKDEKRQERLLERLNDSLKNMEDVTAPALLAIGKEKDHARKVDRVLTAMDVIGVQLQETFMPLALEYGKAEEADAYDETRVTVLLTRLMAAVFDKTSEEYTDCEEQIEHVGEVLSHPMNRFRPDVFIDKNEKGDCIVYLPPAYSTLVKLIEGGKSAEPQPSAQEHSQKPHPKSGLLEVGTAFPFVKYANREKGEIQMRVVWDGEWQDHIFYVTNTEQWKVIRQLVESNEDTVKIDKSNLDDKRSIANLFRGEGGCAFYKYMRCNSKGRGATWSLVQTPQNHSQD